MPALHPKLKGPWLQCESVRRDLLSILEHVTPREWTLRPDPSGWTVGESVDHLIRAETGTSKMATRLIRGDFAGMARPEEARLYDSGLSVYPYGRFPAPSLLVPTAIPFEGALDRLSAAHARFLEELSRFDGPDPDAIASEDQDTGWWYTLGGWVRLQALHEEHHAGLIRGVLAVL